MKIVRIVGQVFINGVPAEVGMDVLPEDMLDARDAEVEFENGAVLLNINANFGYLIGIKNSAEPTFLSQPFQFLQPAGPFVTSDGLVGTIEYDLTPVGIEIPTPQPTEAPTPQPTEAPTPQPAEVLEL